MSKTITPTNNTSTEVDSKNLAQKKYSASVMKLGYVIIPKLMFEGQGKLGLTPAEANILAHLLFHWWEAGSTPYVSKETISRRMGKGGRQIQRYLTSLERKGFIKRIERYTAARSQTANGYDLSGLVAKLKEIEPAFTKEREQKRLRSKKLETSS